MSRNGSVSASQHTTNEVVFLACLHISNEKSEQITSQSNDLVTIPDPDPTSSIKFADSNFRDSALRFTVYWFDILS